MVEISQTFVAFSEYMNFTGSKIMRNRILIINGQCTNGKKNKIEAVKACWVKSAKRSWQLQTTVQLSLAKANLNKIKFFSTSIMYHRIKVHIQEAQNMH